MNQVISIGQTVYFLPYKCEANDSATYMYEIKRRNIPGFLSGTVIEKGLRWRSSKLDGKPKIERLELIPVKDNATGNLWALQADRIITPEFQPKI
jgi:hypothetical protein